MPQAPQVQGMGFRSKTAPAYFEKTVFRLSPEQVMVLRDSFDDELAKLKARGLRSEDVLHLHVEGSANYVSAPDAIVAEYDGPAISGVNVLHADGSKRVHSYAVGAKLTNIDLAVLRAHAAYQAVQNMLPLGMKVGVSYSAREFATENPELRMAQVTISARSE
ncbi:hypothetical protein DSM19430T_26300 [Desulfovibrio psychrotolerans]|uniref:Uncharacterized protein n=1 Tax=Desulfovibrio psychrotolerans TaxID=415242 RepID=A0A7J0BW44_9BACT|nr:hypothetical protein DSM19430T_26300 [Desulfovibrio psychrotolerans]